MAGWLAGEATRNCMQIYRSTLGADCRDTGHLPGLISIPHCRHHVSPHHNRQRAPDGGGNMVIMHSNAMQLSSHGHGY